MQKLYRKKPVAVWVEGPITEPRNISTLEGTMLADTGDFVITGVQGEQYPCKPDIFAETYSEIVEIDNSDLKRARLTLLIMTPLLVVLGVFAAILGGTISVAAVALLLGVSLSFLLVSHALILGNS